MIGALVCAPSEAEGESYRTTNLISAPETIFCPAKGCWLTTIAAADGAPVWTRGVAGAAPCGEFSCGKLSRAVLTGFCPAPAESALSIAGCGLKVCAAGITL